MIWLAGAVIVVLWVECRRLKRQRDQFQLLWLQDALEKREQLEAAYAVVESLLDDETERLEDGRILLPPMSLN